MRIIRPKYLTKVKVCKADDIALKTFFLGPQAENIDQVSEIFAHIIYRWSQYRRSKFPSDGLAISSMDQTSMAFQKRRNQIAHQLDLLISSFEDEIPKFSPRYLGHMFSEISLPALYGSFLALLHNPNNISEEASQVGLRIEEQAIRALSKMVGFGNTSVGHFTSCGTIANLEAALRARRWAQSEKPNALFYPRHSHYCWEKIALTMGLGPQNIFWVDLDHRGRISTIHLNQQIQSALERNFQPTLVVSVLGTTEFGISDPVHHVQKSLETWRKKEIQIWHHVDGAYGGFFASLKNHKQSLLTNDVQRALGALSKVDSITIDPHKLGYVPYASGSFLCRRKSRYPLPKLDSPYLAARQNATHLSTFEGSRSAAGALSVYMTAKTLGFGSEGFGSILRLSLESKMRLFKELNKIKNLKIVPVDDLNILSFVLAKQGESTRKVSRRSLSVYKSLSPPNLKAPYFVTKTVLNLKRYPILLNKFVNSWRGRVDADLIVIRLCLMNPFLTSKEPRVSYLSNFAETLDKICDGLD